MKRFYACLAVSILLHVSVLVPIQLLARHSFMAFTHVIKVSLVDKPVETSIKEKSVAMDEVEPEVIANDNSPVTELVRKAALEEKAGAGMTDDISYEKGAKVDPSYHGKLKARIFNMYSYPEEAVYNGIQGTAVISFVIEPSGMASSLRIKKSSGYRILDDASLMAIKNASPFEPLENSLKIDATFRYVID
jgi:TonB family protein